ncbi:family 16 glycosylhydrolase [Nonomuraea sp. NPDC049649]|uniref:glycoside hydrolase family 16 protein n=1 Tax=Nonomuraea sp. NPDC049649 TaxID=3155776 RepID=UPI00342ED800
MIINSNGGTPGISRRRLLGSAAAVGGLSLGLSSVPGAAHAATWENIIEKSCFDSSADFARYWNYNYPWEGEPDAHNGAARMHPSQVSIDQGVLTLTADRLSAPDGRSTHEPHAPLWYRSGAIHARQQIVVDDRFPEYDIEGEFRTDTGFGVWPAFWTTGVWPVWPPETDILEYVGDSVNLFNTWYRDPGTGSATYERTTVEVENPGEWHTYRVWMVKDGDDVLLDYYFGRPGGKVWQATHRGIGWAGIPMWLIVNLQMGSWASGVEEGKRGWEEQPGPVTAQFQARNVWAGRTRTR